MSTTTKIQWTDTTWNPTTGCDKVSMGCKHCYAERTALRMQRMGQPNYRNGFQLTVHPHMLELPLKWKKPQRIFVNSMSDLFHQDVPDLFIRQVFDTMRRAHWHTFQILTKRAARLLELGRVLPWPPNVWMGVSVEDHKVLGRITALRQTPAAVRFLSCEPLIGPLDALDLTGIDWVIVGGESGPGCQPMDLAWARSIQAQCKAQSTAFFMKQLGGVWDKRGELEQLPEDLRVREFPQCSQ